MRIYLDSNVFISLMNREIGRGFRGLFTEAEFFFRKLDEKYTIVLSELFFAEVEKKIYLNKKEILAQFTNLGVIVEILPNPEKTIRTSDFIKRGLHHLDAVHAALAITGKCDCIVTFNKKDFDKINDLIPVFQPLDFF